MKIQDILYLILDASFWYFLKDLDLFIVSF